MSKFFRASAFMLGVLVCSTSIGSAAPAARWTPSDINVVATPGQSGQVTVNFQTFEDVSNVQFAVTDPRLARLITFSALPAHLAKNTIIPVTVSYSVPASGLSQSRLEGDIVIGGTAGGTASATVSGKPLKLVLTTVDRASLGGTDADHNGIRDDIDRYIARTFTDPKKRAVARQFAASVQSSVLQAGDKAASLENAGRLAAAIDCFSSFPSESFGRQVLEIQALTLDNEARSNAWFAYSDQLAGAYLTGIVGNKLADACD